MKHDDSIHIFTQPTTETTEGISVSMGAGTGQIPVENAARE